MQAPEPFLIFTRKLEDLGLRYMVSGGVASIYYGEPRLTNDVDIVLFLRRADVSALASAFPPSDFYCPPAEVIECERIRDRRGHFNVIHHETGFRADVYLSGRDELHVWGIRNAVRAMIDGDSVCFAPPEYVIVRKLQFFRDGGADKHIRDIHRMLVSLGEEWSRTTLDAMVREERLETEWSRVDQAAEPS
ncbi:MAG TPA: hypothetical protein PLA50_17560 [Bacteroidia bacterium]|nr:hypothetical protein [Bacteroidia bacterium]